jgi:hypothetical protein
VIERTRTELSENGRLAVITPFFRRCILVVVLYEISFKPIDSLEWSEPGQRDASRTNQSSNQLKPIKVWRTILQDWA